MKVFETIQKRYATLGISPSNQWTQNYSLNTRILSGLLLFAYLILSQLAYIFHVASGFMEYLVCICTTSATFIICVSFVAIVYRKTTLFECIDNMEKLIDARCKYPESEAHFLLTNHQVERLCKILFTFMVKILFQCFMLPKFIVSFGIYFTTDSRSDSFQLPFPMWFPFDWNNPIGYAVAFTIEYVLLGYEYVVMASSLSLVIGGYWFAMSAIKEFKRFAPMINDRAKAEVRVKVKVEVKTAANANANEANELKTLVMEFIEAQGIVKQVVHDFSDIFQPIAMSLFTWSLLAIAVVMLIIQVEILDQGKDMPMFVLKVCGLFGLAFVFIACELSQRMTDAFEEIGSAIDQFDWYLFPIELKRMLPMIMAFVQRPVGMECFGSIACTRDTFEKILHRAYSYFMVLRQFEN